MKQFNPLLEPRISRAKVESFFKGPTSVMQKTYKENPQLYRELREAAQFYGIVGEKTYRDESNSRSVGPQPEQFNEEELTAMAAHSPEECRAFFGRSANDADGGPIPGKLATTDPEAYRSWKLAAQCHGVLDRDPAVQVRDARPKPAQQPEAPKTMVLSDETADFFNLPRGHRALEANGLKLIEHMARLKSEAAEKVAADAKPSDAGTDTDKAA